MSATKRVRGPGRKFLAFATVIALMLVGAMAGNVSLAAADTSLPSPSPLKQRDDKLVTADELPTVQINDGYVWAQTTVGTTVYAVGQFSNVRPAGAAVRVGSFIGHLVQSGKEIRGASWRPARRRHA